MIIPSQPVFSWSPAPRIAAVTPSNTTNLQGTLDPTLVAQNVIARRLVIGGAGNIYVDVAGNAGLYSDDGVTAIGATASGTVTMSGTNSGDTDHVVVNSTDVSFTAGVTDVLSATAAVTALNANTTVNKLITASNGGGTLAVVTLTAVSPGKFANGVTTTASGTGVTADQGALAGGTGGSGNYVKYAVVAGQKLEINATKVYALGTTATTIVAEW